MRPSASSQLTQFLKMSLLAGVGGAWWRMELGALQAPLRAPQEQAVSAGAGEKRC